MEATAFLELYRSDLVSVYAVWLLPALFLAWLLATPTGRAAARSPDADVRWVRAYCIAFAIETIVDPFATGPLVRRLGVADAPLGTAILLAFVLLGDFRVYLLVLRLARPARGTAAAAGAAALWTLLVPVSAFAIDHALRAALGALPDQTIWLVYELCFLAVALWMRARAIERWADPDCERQRQLESVAGYVALYYGLWAASDVLILAFGLDLGWALRIVPNQLYYAFYLPYAYFQVASRS
ncbi:MAG TPA: hypothetical protein VFD92_22025 [Candidatus Binatia bacterium]|nr:hypothetical protein [Candidatus Binatia bacterium]